MKPHEFHQIYANLPMKERDTLINVDGAKMSLNDIYHQMRSLQDIIRPHNIQIEKFVSAFNWYLINKDK